LVQTKHIVIARAV